MRLPWLYLTRQSYLRPESAPSSLFPLLPLPSLHPDYFITICLQAGIALLKPQIIIITIIRNSCGGGVGTPSEKRVSVSAGPGIIPFELRGPQGVRVPPKPANGMVVSSTHPTCQEGDAVGFIFLIDTFLSHSTLSHLNLILPFIFLLFSEKNPFL
jgi:hypothetical protein